MRLDRLPYSALHDRWDYGFVVLRSGNMTQITNLNVSSRELGVKRSHI